MLRELCPHVTPTWIDFTLHLAGVKKSPQSHAASRCAGLSAAHRGAASCFDRRVQVEDALENEAAAAGSAWLGQIVGGVWEIRQRAVLPALNRVLTGLVATGAVYAVPPQKSGRAHMIYLAANQYFAGEEFPRPSSQKRPREEPEVEPEEELADIELERLRNIQRNQEILRQLGLA